MLRKATKATDQPYSLIGLTTHAVLKLVFLIILQVPSVISQTCSIPLSNSLYCSSWGDITLTLPSSTSFTFKDILVDAESSARTITLDNVTDLDSFDAALHNSTLLAFEQNFDGCTNDDNVQGLASLYCYMAIRENACGGTVVPKVRDCVRWKSSIEREYEGCPFLDDLRRQQITEICNKMGDDVNGVETDPAEEERCYSHKRAFFCASCPASQNRRDCRPPEPETTSTSSTETDSSTNDASSTNPPAGGGSGDPVESTTSDGSDAGSGDATTSDDTSSATSDSGTDNTDSQTPTPTDPAASTENSTDPPTQTDPQQPNPTEPSNPSNDSTDTDPSSTTTTTDTESTSTPTETPRSAQEIALSLVRNPIFLVFLIVIGSLAMTTCFCICCRRRSRRLREQKQMDLMTGMIKSMNGIRRGLSGRGKKGKGGMNDMDLRGMPPPGMIPQSLGASVNPDMAQLYAMAYGGQPPYSHHVNLGNSLSSSGTYAGSSHSRLHRHNPPPAYIQHARSARSLYAPSIPVRGEEQDVWQTSYEGSLTDIHSRAARGGR